MVRQGRGDGRNRCRGDRCRRTLQQVSALSCFIIFPPPFLFSYSQLRELLTIAPPEATEKLRATICKMRDEELEHLSTAEQHQTRRSNISVTTLSSLVRVGCRAAIALVSRV